MVRPNLCHPAIRRQYLILLVLRTKNRQHLSPRNKKNISGWWQSDRVYARQICQSYYTEVCRSLPAICLRYSRLDPWQGTSPKVSCWDRIFDPRCTLVESMKGDTHTHTRAYTHTYASRNEYKSIFPGLNGRVSVECRYFCPSGN